MPSKPRSLRKEHSPAIINTILNLHERKYSFLSIARILELPRSTISSIVYHEKHRKKLETSPKKRTGRPPKLSARDQRHLILSVDKNPFNPLSNFLTPSKSGHHLSRYTARQYLHKNERYAFKPRKKPYLKPIHKDIRRAFGIRYRDWSDEDNACVSYSDEAMFEVGLDISSQYVRRPKKKGFESKYLLPTFKSGRTSVGIWAAISWDFKSKLVFVPSHIRMNSKEYIKIILLHSYPHYIRILEKRGIALWAEDGARYHTSKLIKDWMNEWQMDRVEWPAQSPDLNPIENLWAIMKHRISKIRYRIHSEAEMRKELQLIWDSITQEEIQDLIRSIPRRMQAVIKARGGSTKY
ncbi:hypothetical protein I7I53_03681 [Histoplasma capsulatum var. duboisii H88]|uniref:Tc1-like transposase DDE domain-containing protein n=1 Tax=Ajellomyces capsulatus (strain H88) TaxID=544711 RepID=A0A8A1LP08_AJEC8|nr:hypothetical protein I7I53_03681 [Histoplasma capsulatum var. duboisii H88]